MSIRGEDDAATVGELLLDMVPVVAAPQPDLAAQVVEVRRRFGEALAWPVVPVERLLVQRSVARVFDRFAMTWTSHAESALALPAGLAVRAEPVAPRHAKFEATLAGDLDRGRLTFVLEHAVDVVDPTLAQTLLDRVVELLLTDNTGRRRVVTAGRVDLTPLAVWDPPRPAHGARPERRRRLTATETASLGALAGAAGVPLATVFADLHLSVVGLACGTDDVTAWSVTDEGLGTVGRTAAVPDPVARVRATVHATFDGPTPVPDPAATAVVVAPTAGYPELALVTAFHPEADGWQVVVVVDPTVVSDRQHAATVGLLETVLAAAVAWDESGRPLLAPAAQAELLRHGDGGPATGRRRSLLDALRAQVEQRPDRPAVEFDDAAWTYAQLWERAGAWTAALAARGVGRGDRVAVGLGPGAEHVAATVGVMGLGAAFVVVDPRQPVASRRAVVADAAPRLLVTRDDDLGTGVAVLDPADVRTPPGPVPWAEVGPDDPAYLVYTSGSTGTPKGSVNHHLGLLRHLETPRGSSLPARAWGRS